MRNHRKWMLLLAAGPLAASVSASQPTQGGRTDMAAALPAPPANGEMGFVVSHFAPAIYQGKEDCPEGLAATLRETYLQTQPAGERARLLDKANEKELTARWTGYARGPGDINICTHPDQFDRPPQHMVQGAVAKGLNLDDDASGSAAGDTCQHHNFSGPGGEAGIDNQAWRAMGCVRSWRGVDGVGGDIVRGLTQFLVSGEHSQVLLLTGVDSLVDDPDVTVIYANTEDRAVVDSRQNFIPGASYSVTANAAHRNVLKGRISQGVLTTEPAHIRLKQNWGQGAERDIRGRRNEYDFTRARLRLTFQKDGSLKGIVGGYQPIWNVMASASIGGEGAATVAGYDCAAMYAAIKAMADGDRDPATGQCRRISTGIEAEAVPAFVNDRLPRATVAQR